MKHLTIVCSAALGVLLLLTACSPEYTKHVAPAPTPGKIKLYEKEIATLAFASYAGDKLDNTDPSVDKTLESCIAWELERQPLLSERYTLAWGPSAYRFDFALLDDNMMYAAWELNKDGSPSTNLVIAIRGTNPASPSDWIDEDFFVTKTVPWAFANPVNDDARISHATNLGLKVLRGLKGENHTPGCNGSVLLKEFLIENVNLGRLKKVTVTGHSLAGALAPVLALWINDAVFTKVNIEDRKVAIHVLPIAGATAGNLDFANYYDSKLSSTTNRLHNPFDVVPQAWTLKAMQALPSIYYLDKENNILPSFAERAAFKFGIELSKGKQYTHIKATQKSTGGVVNWDPEVSTFLGQAGWQHHCGYYNALGMTEKVWATNGSCISKIECLTADGVVDTANDKCTALFKPYCSPPLQRVSVND